MPAARMGKSNGKRATPEEAKRSVKRLLHYSTKYYPFEFWMSIFCIIFSGITGVLPMVFIGVVVDEISSILDKTYTVTLASLGLSINNVSLQLIGTQIVVIACILVAGLAANYFYNFLMSRLAQGVQKRIRDDLFNHMVTIKELETEKMIIRSANSGTRQLFEASLHSQGLSLDDLNLILEVDNIATIKELLVKNIGVSVLAKSACLDEEKNHKLVLLPIEGLAMTKS